MLVSRDPFARSELHRATIATRESCRWCGSHRTKRDGARIAPGMFYYFTESDGGRRGASIGPFDSVSCFRAFAC